MRRAGLGVASLACVLAASCADNPRQRFERTVAPVLARRCGTAACHGARPDGSSAREFFFRTDADGHIPGDALDAAYASARRFINTTEGPALSTLLRKATPPGEGGLAHAGGAAFYGRSDAAWVAVRDWIALEQGGGEDGHPETLTEGERFFACGGTATARGGLVHARALPRGGFGRSAAFRSGGGGG
jgi:hypothetical protein